jgi:hypothetical protein
MSGTDFELYVYRAIRARFPRHKDWEIEEQPTLPSGNRPDFVVSRCDHRFVIDAKDKGALELRDLDQILVYAKKLNARGAIIYLANDTDISDSVWEYAQNVGIELRRTQW